MGGPQATQTQEGVTRTRLSTRYSQPVSPRKCHVLTCVAAARLRRDPILSLSFPHSLALAARSTWHGLCVSSMLTHVQSASPTHKETSDTHRQRQPWRQKWRQRQRGRASTDIQTDFDKNTESYLDRWRQRQRDRETEPETGTQTEQRDRDCADPKTEREREPEPERGGASTWSAGCGCSGARRCCRRPVACASREGAWEGG
eukprot:1498192-Rhodomonas_salina.1